MLMLMPAAGAAAHGMRSLSRAATTSETNGTDEEDESNDDSDEDETESDDDDDETDDGDSDEEGDDSDEDESDDETDDGENESDDDDESDEVDETDDDSDETDDSDSDGDETDDDSDDQNGSTPVSSIGRELAREFMKGSSVAAQFDSERDARRAIILGLHDSADVAHGGPSASAFVAAAEGEDGGPDDGASASLILAPAAGSDSGAGHGNLQAASKAVPEPGIWPLVIYAAASLIRIASIDRRRRISGFA
jgi:hypothetical protein